MNWSGTGFGIGWEGHFRELEHFVRRLRAWRSAPSDPDEELPGVELSTGEQQAALQREIMRRRVRDTTP